jgi:serine/threonine protein kinase
MSSAPSPSSVFASASASSSGTAGVWSVGDVVDGFVIEELIGEGGQCVVYRAHDPALDRHVALKVAVKTDGAAAEDLERRRARLEREAKALAKVQSTRVARVYGMRRVGGEPYVILEYCRGATLAKLLSRQRHLPVDRALALAKEIALGVQAIHDVGLVHRDLKPHNIIVDVIDGTEHVKVIDLGIAKNNMKGRAERSLTRVDDIVGTIGFMSPEQMLRKTVDARADVYAFGALLYRVLSGMPVFAATTLPAMVRAHVHQKPVSLLVRAPHLRIPAAVDDVVLACLEKDPEHRPSSLAEVAYRLASISLAGDDLTPLWQPGAADVTRPQTTPPVHQIGLMMGVTAVPHEIEFGLEERTASEPPKSKTLPMPSTSESSAASARVFRFRAPTTPKPVTMFGASIHDEHTM